MKIKEVKIELDKDAYLAGENVTGHLIVRTNNANWAKFGKIYLKFYDKLNIEWVEDERMAVGITKVVYTNLSKAHQINGELFLNEKNATQTPKDDDNEFIYPFQFTIPAKLMSTLQVKNARSQYFLKAYLTTDEAVWTHYQIGVNVFDEFFKSLNHTLSKKEVIIKNQLAPLPKSVSTHVYEAKSQNLKVTVTLPKIFYSRDETIPIKCKIEHVANEHNHNHKLELHKVAFKLFQLVKLVANEPHEKSRLFETLIVHTSRKSVAQNSSDGSILIEEYLKVPNDILSSSSRVSSTDTCAKAPIRVNYKLTLEFWKNFMVNELDLNVPLMVDPEL